MTRNKDIHELNMNRCCKFGRLLMSTFGTWPRVTGNCFLHLVRLVLSRFIIISLFTIACLSLVQLVVHDHGMLDISYRITLVSRQICTLRKCYIFIYRPSFRQFFYENNFVSFTVPKHLFYTAEKFKNNCYKTPKACILIFILFSFVFLPIWNISINKYEENKYNNNKTNQDINRKSLPMEIWHPFDFDTNPMSFMIITIIEHFTIIFACCIIFGFNVFYISLSTICARMLDHMEDILLTLHQVEGGVAKSAYTSQNMCNVYDTSTILQDPCDIVLHHFPDDESNLLHEQIRVEIHNTSDKLASNNTQETNYPVLSKTCPLAISENSLLSFESSIYGDIPHIIISQHEASIKSNLSLNSLDVTDYQRPICRSMSSIFKTDLNNQHRSKINNRYRNLSDPGFYYLANNNPVMNIPGDPDEGIDFDWTTALKPEQSSQFTNADKLVMETLQYAVQHHQRTVRFINCVNDNFSGTMLLDIWSVVLIMCVLAFHVASSEQGVLRTSALTQNFIIHFIFFALICWSSNEVLVKLLSWTFSYFMFLYQMYESKNTNSK